MWKGIALLTVAACVAVAQLPADADAARYPYPVAERVYAEPLPQPYPAVQSYPAVHVKYRTRGEDRSCVPPLRIHMPVQDPRCCEKIVEVPMCIPGCCTEMPRTKSYVGLLGRGVVWYEWCCGFRARVSFYGDCDVVVTYFYH